MRHRLSYEFRQSEPSDIMCQMDDSVQGCLLAPDGMMSKFLYTIVRLIGGGCIFVSGTSGISPVPFGSFKLCVFFCEFSEKFCTKRKVIVSNSTQLKSNREKRAFRPLPDADALCFYFRLQAFLFNVYTVVTR